MNKNNKKPNGSHGNGNYGEVTKSARHKGKHGANLQKRGFLHFQIGLILALLLVYIGLEVSFRMQEVYSPPTDLIENAYVMYEQDLPTVRVDREIEEKVVRRSSAKVVEVPDETVIIKGEEVIEIPVDAPKGIDLNAGDINFEEPPVEEEIDFIRIEDAPIYPGCEGVVKSERLSCFQEKITKHINRNIRYPEIERNLGIEGKVFVTFKINKEGNISDVQLKGPSKGLEKEAERIISKLPQMTPGKQRGTPVRVPFSMPINFVLKK